LGKVFKIAILVFAINCVIGESYSQEFKFFELENLSNITEENYFRPQINIYSRTFKESSQFGFYYFALANKNWGEAYAGVVYKPIDWLLISVGAGLELNDDPYRFNFNLHMFWNRISLIQVYEYGGSGFWYNILLNYELTESSYLGIIAERYYGLGIKYEYILKKIPLGLNIAPLYDFEDSNYKLLIALRYYY